MAKMLKIKLEPEVITIAAKLLANNSLRVGEIEIKTHIGTP